MVRIIRSLPWLLLMVTAMLVNAGASFAVSTENMVAASKPSIVRILVEVRPGDNELLQFYNFKPNRKILEPVRVKAGTGFVVNENGYIMTTYHVVAPLGKSPDIYVRLPKEGDQLAEVVAVDRERQLACLKIKKFNMPFLAFEKEEPSVGSDVFTMGFPFAADTSEITDQEATFTEGKVGAMKQSRQEAAFIQTNVAINLGNAGGPLLDGNGHIVGTVVGSADRSLKKIFEVIFAEKDIPVGIGFATPAKAGMDMLQAAGIPYHMAPPPSLPPKSLLQKLLENEFFVPSAIITGIAVAGLVSFLLVRRNRRPREVSQPSAIVPQTSTLPKDTTVFLGCIRCSEGELAGKTFPLTTRGLMLGRSDGTDIRLSSDIVSREHAWIGPNGSDIIVKDLGSTNGTFVNGAKINGPQIIQKGDAISLSKGGQESFVFAD